MRADALGNQKALPSVTELEQAVRDRHRLVELAPDDAARAAERKPLLRLESMLRARVAHADPLENAGPPPKPSPPKAERPRSAGDDHPTAAAKAGGIDYSRWDALEYDSD